MSDANKSKATLLLTAGAAVAVQVAEVLFHEKGMAFKQAQPLLATIGGGLGVSAVHALELVAGHEFVSRLMARLPKGRHDLRDGAIAEAAGIAITHILEQYCDRRVYRALRMTSIEQTSLRELVRTFNHRWKGYKDAPLTREEIQKIYAVAAGESSPHILTREQWDEVLLYKASPDWIISTTTRTFLSKQLMKKFPAKFKLAIESLAREGGTAHFTIMLSLLGEIAATIKETNPSAASGSPGATIAPEPAQWAADAIHAVLALPPASFFADNKELIEWLLEIDPPCALVVRATLSALEQMENRQADRLDAAEGRVTEAVGRSTDAVTDEIASLRRWIEELTRRIESQRESAAPTGGAGPFAPIDRSRVRERVRAEYSELFLIDGSCALLSLYQETTISQVSTESAVSPVPEAGDKNRPPEGVPGKNEAGQAIRRLPSKRVVTVMRELAASGAAWSLPLIGDPGAGKTSLLKWIAYQAASDGRFLTGEESGLIPAYVSAERFSGRLDQALAEQHDYGLTREDWRRLLEAGSCLILVDGIELADNASDIRTQLQVYDRCSAILACRTALRSRLERVTKATPFILDPLTESQQSNYVEGYPSLNAAQRQRASGVLASRRDLRSLFSNPYLLSLLCFQASRNTVSDETSMTRSSLYKGAVEGMLSDIPSTPDRMQARRENPVEYPDTKSALGYAALFAVERMFSDLGNLDADAYALKADRSHQANSGVLPLDTFREGLSQWIAERALTVASLKPLLRDLLLNSQIVSGDVGVPDRVAFSHRTLQEYLIASGIADIGEREERKGGHRGSVHPEAGWRAMRRYVDALSWLPHYEETIVLLAGELLSRKMFSALSQMLSWLGSMRGDDHLNHRLALAAMCIPEISGVPLPVELRDCGKQIISNLLQAFERMLSIIGRHYVVESTSVPARIEDIPVGRAMAAVAGCYREQSPQCVAIPLGGELFDPAGLNAEFLTGEIGTASSSRAGSRSAHPRMRFTNDASLDEMLPLSWKLALLGPALALPPIRDSLLRRTNGFQWRCIANPVGAAIAHSDARDAQEWFEWICLLVDECKEGMIYGTLAPAISRAPQSLIAALVPMLLDHVEQMSPWATRRAGPNQNLQEWTCYVLAHLLRGEMPEEVREHGIRVMVKISQPSAWLCLVHLGLRSGTANDALDHFLASTDSKHFFIQALRVATGRISIEEALPDFLGIIGPAVFDCPSFVRSLNDSQRKVVLAAMIEEIARTNADNLNYEEPIAALITGGTSELRDWGRETLMASFAAATDDRTQRFFRQTVLRLGEDGVGLAELPDHILRVASGRDGGWRQQLISMSGGLAITHLSVRELLRRAAGGDVDDAIREDYRQWQLHQKDESIRSSEGGRSRSGLAERLVGSAVVKNLKRERANLAAQPVAEVKLPGMRELRYAAAVALARGGLSHLSTEVRSQISESLSGSETSLFGRADWGVDVARDYSDLRHPWIDWIQTGVRIGSRLKPSRVHLAVELAEHAFAADG